MNHHEDDRLKFSNDALEPEDILAQAIGGLRDEPPAHDLWPGVAARIQASPRRTIAVTWSQLAVAASLLIAVSAGLTWLVARQPVATPASSEAVVQAQDEPMGSAAGQVQPANFADKQFDAAVTDLEKILLDDRDRLDPATVMVIERNLRTIDDAIAQAREALDKDPANPYLNSHLADSRRRKLELLRRATTLASTSGD
ncbi:MAG: hypothetical protein ABI665_08355 [Vicinamibacterales bacterium]